jgi:hypothetical protein
MRDQNLKELYSPARVSDQLKRRPGVAIIGDKNWNRDRDMMTLAEIRKYDDENHRLILKECREYRYNTFEECAAAKWHAWAWAMKKLGVRIVTQMDNNPEIVRRSPAFFEHQLEKELKEKGIRLEERPPKYINVEQDLWKSGMYVYYHGDIVYFISNPMSVRAKEGSIYLANRVQFIIMTNARVDGRESTFRSAEVSPPVRETEGPPEAGALPESGAGTTEVRSLDADIEKDSGFIRRIWRKLTTQRRGRVRRKLHFTLPRL